MVEIDPKSTLFQVTCQYPEAVDLLVTLGFPALKDEQMRRAMGSSISILDALKMKGIPLATFCDELESKVQENGREKRVGALSIQGVLPCPVRVPLTEAFEKFLEMKEFAYPVDYELKAASMGIDWIKDTLENKGKEELPDLFISAGFDLFFDEKLFGHYKAENLFEDFMEYKTYNEDFQNEEMDLRDPKGQYSIISVVPAVFLVNEKELGTRKMPTSWEDILHEDFANSVSLPVGDFDLFNAILLNISKVYGDEGIKKLGRSMQKSMHPSEMVKSHKMLLERPSVTIMPYFFTKMVKEGGPMVAVWPRDGAIISPIFMLSKKDSKEKVQPFVDFFASKEIGEILSHNGRFPSVNPEVDNRVPKENNYMWLGWDYLKNQDISTLIKDAENLFNESMMGGL